MIASNAIMSASDLVIYKFNVYFNMDSIDGFFFNQPPN